MTRVRILIIILTGLKNLTGFRRKCLDTEENLYTLKCLDPELISVFSYMYPEKSPDIIDLLHTKKNMLINLDESILFVFENIRDVFNTLNKTYNHSFDKIDEPNI
uniref:Uncharacterized protein n=1 Tax=Cyanoptyche gloeocystis TaxID=77922 RepID=A0A3G1IW52_9EUKA|nr:hypothetical protein [Cyanoptyche gloeocystis]